MTAGDRWAGVKARLERLLGLPPVAVVVRVVDVYGRAAGGLLAQGLAFTALFAAVPTMLLVLGVSGRLLGDPSLQVAIVDALTRAFPPLEPLFAELLGAVVRGSGVTSVLGLVGLLWAASQFYVAADTAFARIFVDTPERDPVRRTIRGFVWVAVILVPVVAVVVLGSVSSVARALLPGEIELAGTVATIATAPPTLVALAVGLLAIAYRVLPPRAPSWRAIRLPAVLAGIAVVALTQVFMLIAPRLVGAAAVAGSLAAAFVALAWLSFTFQAILLGAAWVAVRAGRPRPPKPPEQAG